MAGANKTVMLDEKAWSASGDLFYPGWTGDPNVGLRRNAAVSIQADFTKAGFYTLQFGVTPPTLRNGFDLSGNVVAQAEVLWSVKGNFIRRFFNIYNGTTISGAGEGILVRIRDASQPNVFVDEPLAYQVTANLIPGVRHNMANGMPPIYTPRDGVDSLLFPGTNVYPPYPLPAGPSQLEIPVPKNCGVTSVLLNIARQTDEGGNEPVTIENSQILIQQMNASGSLSWLNYDSCYGFQPLAPGTTVLRLNNQTDTSDPSDITLVWVTPIFGIDG